MKNKTSGLNLYALTTMLLIALITSVVITPTHIVFADTPITRPPDVNHSLDQGVQDYSADQIVEETATIQSVTQDSCTSAFQSGGDRLANLQNTDGGWDWPLDNGDPDNSSPANTIGPISMGLAHTYFHTNDSDHLFGLQKAGTFLLAKTSFSPSDGYMAAMLDSLLGGTTYVDFINANFYDKLALGTYERGGVYYDTAGYVNLIRDARQSQGIPNLAAWDIGMGLVGAASVDADTSDWIAGVKAEIDELDGNAIFDVIGLAGAVYGLAYVGEDYDPISGEHAAANNLKDLADILASYQIDGGGFTWNKNYLNPGESNETIQETAYSVLALNEVDRTIYYSNIYGASEYMKSVQLSTGGWKNWEGAGENNEVTGEALWGISVALPGPITSNVEATPNPVGINNPLTISADIDNYMTGCSNVTSATYTIFDSVGGTIDTGPLSNSFNSPFVHVSVNITAPSEAGIYGLCVYGTDEIGNSGDESCIMLVVYDPDGGFVTGGGWIDSPPDATNILVWDQGFEIDTAGWYDSNSEWYGMITQVPSGDNGITSSAGSYHAIVEGDASSAPFTRFDGFRDSWLGSWTAKIDIYLDPNWASGEGFDYSVAATGSDGNHQRDYIFHVTKDTSTSKLLVAGSNNTNFAPREDLENINHYDVSTAGWYSFQHVFYESSGALAVDLNLLDSSDTVLFTETRFDPADIIPDEVGGNRYGWFTFANISDGFAVDEHQLTMPTGLTGKANFGFVSKYKKGADAPTGNTEFIFQAGDLNFHSTSYDWLLVTGSDYAKFKGVGTINGEDEYKFMLWAGDKEPDTFRIKIWYEVDDVEFVVYDNGTDQDIGGGNIVIHTKKQ